MIWVILAVIGIPLWIIALGLGVLLYRNRVLRLREGNIPCRLQDAAGGRWSRGHGIWVHDVFAFRASPASWKDRMAWVEQVTLRPPNAEEARKLRRLADPVIAEMLVDDGSDFRVATDDSRRSDLTGPISPSAVID